MSLQNLTTEIKNKAREIGFDLVGIAYAKPSERLNFFREWISKGYAGTMGWLVRSFEKRSDPRKVLDGAKTVICCGLKYYRGHPFSINCQEKGRGWISSYCWGDDYHYVLSEKLKLLEDFIRERVSSASLKSYVDTGPVLEKDYANRAGLGWIGKNTCLINKKEGSLFFIGEIITDLDLVCDSSVPDHCGKCTKCIEACPTKALKPYEMDAGRCISYLTIEHRGEIDPSLRKKMGRNIVGCDICQDVCPWNQKLSLSKEETFDPHPGNFHPCLESLSGLSQKEFSKRFKGSSVKRVKWEGLIRNVGIALSKPRLLIWG